MEAFVHQKKKFDIGFTEANTKFSFNFHYNANTSYLFVNGKNL